jgi:hypothetical protein
MIHAPTLAPLAADEYLMEVGRTSTSAAGWVAAVARVQRGRAHLVRIALYNPLVERWMRLDVHPGMVGELAELLAQVSDPA